MIVSICKFCKTVDYRFGIDRCKHCGSRFMIHRDVSSDRIKHIYKRDIYDSIDAEAKDETNES